MKKPLFYLLPILLFLTATIPLHAFHIVGGEVTYECLGGNQYRINLNVYRDCNCTGCAEYDDPAYLYVFNSAGSQVIKREVPLGAISEIPPPDIICAETLPDVCVQETTYSTVVTLPPTAGGYTLAYQRYSRNSTIVNIYSPAETGSTYYTNIPPSGLATCNNSATFNEFPPTIICANNPMFVNQGATDVDGDSLVYEFCSPVIGGDALCPQPGNPINCPGIEASPPPYSLVSFIPPYNGGNPLGGSPQVNINPQTGIITGTPTQVGQYVVGICVTEYRNGVAINVVRRDFQFNVTPCTIVQAAVQSDQIDAAGNFIITNCNNYTVTFQNLSIGATQYYWEFGDSTSTTDFSTLPNPTYAYPDSGRYYVTLIASKPGGCVDTANIILNLYPTLTPLFSFVAGCSYVPVTFTDLSTATYGTITGTYWDYGDGTAEYATNPSHLYANGGNYVVSLNVSTSLGCFLGINQTIYVNPVPTPNFNTTLLCPQQPVNFTDITTNPAAGTWQWDFGNPNDANDQSTQQNPSYTYNTPGTYTVNLNITSTEGCVASTSQTFTIYPLFEADAGPNKEICFGQSTLLEGSDEFSWYNYSWTPTDSTQNAGTRTPTVNPSATTTYTALVSDPNGCTDTDQTIVTVNPLPQVNIVADTLACLGESTTINGVVSSNIQSYEWTNNQGFSNNNTLNLNPTLDSTAVFVLYVLDNNGCEKTDTQTITIINPIIAAFANGDIEICQGESVQLNVSGGDTYVWTPATGLDNANIANPTATPTTTTNYTVTVANICFEDTLSITVAVNPLPIVDAGIDQTINIGESAQLQGSASGSLVWTPPTALTNPNTATPFANPLNTTTYTLSATTDKGCAASDSTTVNVTNIFLFLIPNAFSPNADGTNDVFRIVQSKGIKQLQRFAIYNRWGAKIFETNDLQTGWDGTYKGIQQEMGTYVFFIEGTTFLNETYTTKGNVSLIR